MLKFEVIGDQEGWLRVIVLDSEDETDGEPPYMRSIARLDPGAEREATAAAVLAAPKAERDRDGCLYWRTKAEAARACAAANKVVGGKAKVSR